MNEINIRLKNERKRLEFSQQKFGAVGGVARNAQSNYESGRRMPDANYLAAIATAGADVQYIITGIQSNRSGSVDFTTEELALVKSYRASNNENKTLLEAVGTAFAQQK